MSGEQVIFGVLHQHGLPEDRYSNFIRPLGKGAFGEVHLCCLRTAIPQQQPQQPQQQPLEPQGHQPQQPHEPQGQPQQPHPHLCSRGGATDGCGHRGTCGRQDYAPPPQDCATTTANGRGAHNDQPPPAQQPHQPAQPPQRPDLVYTYEWVAVKLSQPLHEYSRQSLEYLKREVVWQRRLNHMHVIGLREVGITSQNRLYITLEYADSGNLRQWLAARGGRLPEAEARWFFQQLVYGLAYCHAYGVYNRDIKPENLLLHRSGLELPLLKVADFGLCKSSNDSKPNSCVGSPNYMAPEVFMQTAHDGTRADGVPAYDGKKADVFSCGVVLYRMVFGCLPFNRTPDGRPLHTTRDLREIVANMRAERWPQLLPPPPPPAPLGADLGGAAAGAASGGGGGASAALLDLLGGMLRCSPEARMGLDDVKRHPWYREGLSDEIYEMLLSGGSAAGAAAAADAGSGLGGGTAQSVEAVEQQFDRVLAAYDLSRREAARQAAEEEAEEGDYPAEAAEGDDTFGD